MTRKQKPPEPRGESRFTLRPDQNQTVVRLARGDQDTEQRREALRGFFGDLADDKLEEQITKIQEHEDTILAWLSEQPEALAAFVEDPIGALRRQFPALELPAGRKPYVPSRVKIELQPAETTDPVVLEIFQKLYEYVAASEANTHTFETAPFSVIASVGAAYPADKVDQVVRAFEGVFGIYRLSTTAGLLAVAFANRRVL
jgi:hypothetical protein